MKRSTVHVVFTVITVLIVLPFFTIKDQYPFFRFGMFARYTPQGAPTFFRLTLLSKGIRAVVDYDRYHLKKTQIEALGLKFKNSAEKRLIFLHELHQACQLSKRDTLIFEAETDAGDRTFDKFPR
jgi:hypothetical protein